ncbi:MAG: RsmD family RNA methyltransferase, partial [Muribaculaceae bacterium]|nr:RsmD family RNA methyltransferase [Muribaculaceae bacterium]
MRIITGKYGRRRFQVPTNISARPTTDMARENIFNVLENMVDFEGLTALDLFSGTGAISFEFLSRGCASVTSVEKATTQYNFIRKVKQMLNENNLHQIKGDAFKFIETCREKFDI